MADHLRTQIRKAIAAAVGNLTTTQTRVYQNQFYPLAAAELPCLLVYEMNEDPINTRTLGGRRLQDRFFGVVLEAIVRQNDTPDDVLNQIAKEVEAVMAVDPMFGGLCHESRIVRSEKSDRRQSENEVVAVVRKLFYEVFYVTREGSPDVRA